MEKSIKKAIKSVSINYEDGSHDGLDTYVLAGYDGTTWYSVVSLPARNEEKIRLNNLVADLSSDIRKSLKD